MFSDPGAANFKRLRRLYSMEAAAEFITLLKGGFYRCLPILDVGGNPICCIENRIRVKASAYRVLFAPPCGESALQRFMDREIASSLFLEGTPYDQESEAGRTLRIKSGLDFISDSSRSITVENIFKLHSLTSKDRGGLHAGNYYRHGETEGDGALHSQLPRHMRRLVAFINAEDDINDLLKAAAIHFCIVHLRPYFKGNGIMARLIHLWYLARRGYPSVIGAPVSSLIAKNERGYRHALRLINRNASQSGVTDITPFLTFFADKIYNRLDSMSQEDGVPSAYDEALAAGSITEKERDLWGFTRTVYAMEDFSTKKLEKDFGHAAYATIRGFVMKFEKLGLLSSRKFGNRVRYRII
jgi:Fic family protein